VGKTGCEISASKPALCKLVKPLRVLHHCRHTLEDEVSGVKARKPHHVDVAKRLVVRTRRHVSDQAIAASAWAMHGVRG